MANENETDPEADDLTNESAEGEVNWEDRARKLEEKAKLSREKNKEFRNKTETELNELKNELKSLKEAHNSQPTAPDYGKLAYFASKELNHPDDVKVVEDEADRLKLPYTDILGMTHIQTKLQANREERVAKEGLPAGTTGTGVSSKGTVEHWLQQGEGKVPMTPDGNIDQELAEKVIEARVRKETSGSQFAPVH